MTSPNIQRLIVVFLVFAILTSSSLLAVSLYMRSAPGEAATAKNGPSASPFVEKLPGGSTDPEVAALEARDAQNATTELAGILAAQILKDNPNGPAGSGEDLSINVLPTDLNTLIENYIKDHPFSKEVLKPTITNGDLKIVQSSDAPVVTGYLSKIGDLSLELDLSSSLGSADVDVRLQNYLNMLRKSDSGFRSVEVPQPFAELHKTIIEGIQISEAYTALLDRDPIGAAALSDAYDSEITKTSAKLDAEVEHLEKLGLIPDSHRSLVQRILGIQTAYATIPTIDWAHIAWTIKKFYEDYKKEILEVLTEYLKNKLLKMMTQQVVSWIAGNGEPQFVTNWNTFLQQAKDNAIGEVISDIAPALCGSPGSIGASLGLGRVADFIRKILEPANTPTGYPAYPSCTLDRVIQNINDFKSDLRNGGWLAYSAIYEPQNTVIGALIDISDRAAKKSAEKEEQEKNKAVSGSGFTGQEVCDDGQPPGKQITKNFETGEKSTTYGCADGSTPHIATPGIFSKDLSTQGFNAAYDRLVTAKDYKALAAYIADVALSRLFREGAKGLLGYIQKGGRSGGSGGGGDDGGSTAPPPETASTTVKGLAEQILARKQSSLDDARVAADSLGDTNAILLQIVTACASNPTVVADARVQYTALVSVRDQLSLDIEDLKTDVAGLQAAVANPSTYTIASLTSAFGTLDAAQTEAEDYSGKRASAEGIYIRAGNLFASCSTDITSGTPTDSGATTTTSTATSTTSTEP